MGESNFKHARVVGYYGMPKKDDKTNANPATNEVYRVAVRGYGFHVKGGVLTNEGQTENKYSWTAPIFNGDKFSIRSDWGELTGQVTHVIIGKDGGIKHICLAFHGNLRFEGDLSDAEFLIPA